MQTYALNTLNILKASHSEILNIVLNFVILF